MTASSGHGHHPGRDVTAHVHAGLTMPQYPRQRFTLFITNVRYYPPYSIPITNPDWASYL